MSNTIVPIKAMNQPVNQGGKTIKIDIPVSKIKEQINGYLENLDPNKAVYYFPKTGLLYAGIESYPHKPLMIQLPLNLGAMGKVLSNVPEEDSGKKLEILKTGELSKEGYPLYKFKIGEKELLADLKGDIQ